jgi:hypothetical protein
MPGFSLRQEVTQDHGAVVKGVVGAVEQRHGAAFTGLKDGPPGIDVRSQLGPISPLEAWPALNAMTEPFPKLRARGDLFQPEIDLRLFLC